MTAWDISTFSYANKSDDISSEETTPRGLTFNSDGTKMYVTGTAGGGDTYQYTLSTGWDASTSTYASKTLDTSSQESSPHDGFLGDSGDKFYIIGAGDVVYQYNLSTTDDISTASYASKSKDVSSEEGSCNGLCFSTDGTKMYVVGESNDTVYQYTLSTAWDVSSASYASKSLSVSEDNYPQAVFIGNSGSTLYMQGVNGGGDIYQYTLSTAWDVSTGSYDSKSLDVGSQENNCQGMFFKNDGNSCYVVGPTNDTVYQYDAAAADTFTPKMMIY